MIHMNFQYLFSLINNLIKNQILSAAVVNGGLTVNMGNKITLNVILLFVSYPKAFYSYS